MLLYGEWCRLTCSKRLCIVMTVVTAPMRLRTVMRVMRDMIARMIELCR